MSNMGKIQNLGKPPPYGLRLYIKMTNIHSFSDFAEMRGTFSGDKKRMDEILNKPITVRDYKIIPSKKNQNEKCLHLQIEMDGELFVLFTGSGVLIEQCEKYHDKIPFNTTVVKIDKYFTFS